jgi:hypothetical protein
MHTLRRAACSSWRSCLLSALALRPGGLLCGAWPPRVVKVGPRAGSDGGLRCTHARHRRAPRAGAALRQHGAGGRVAARRCAAARVCTAPPWSRCWCWASRRRRRWRGSPHPAGRRTLERDGPAATVAQPGPPREHHARHLRRRPRRGPRPRAPLRPGPGRVPPRCRRRSPRWAPHSRARRPRAAPQRAPRGRRRRRRRPRGRHRLTGETAIASPRLAFGRAPAHMYAGAGATARRRAERAPRCAPREGHHGALPPRRAHPEVVFTATSASYHEAPVAHTSRSASSGVPFSRGQSPPALKVRI